ncbi:hypothetical protein GW7_10074 [Heterocephalus glaber]|uniref:Uncharacterized protein n=1 Tax=Heterocephalus glaber TaxID=10181 RepID=G5BA31_HETGA|nr:hypothetical protein GW7_10074 [Heterocephalus glaber]
MISTKIEQKTSLPTGDKIMAKKTGANKRNDYNETGSKGRNEEHGETTNTAGADDLPNLSYRHWRGSLLRSRERGGGHQDPHPLGENGGPAKLGANWRPEEGEWGEEGVGRGDPGAGDRPSTFGCRAPAGPSRRSAAGEGDAKPAASLTCPALASRPEALAPPGRSPSCGTQPLPPPPPPELQYPGVEDASGVSRGQHRASYGPLLPGLRPKLPPSSGRVSGGHTPPPRYFSSAILWGEHNALARAAELTGVFSPCWEAVLSRRTKPPFRRGFSLRLVVLLTRFWALVLLPGKQIH